MKKRARIEFFRGRCLKKEGEIETFLCPIDETHAFIGKDVAVKDAFHIIYYVLPFADGDAILFAVIEETGQLLDAFEKFSDYDLDVLKPSFPKAIEAMRDGMNANLTGYAIIRLESADGKPFDCVATKISNIDVADLETEYVLRKAICLCKFASDVIEELDWDKVTFWQKAKIYARATYNGVQTAIRVQKIGDFLNNL